MFSKTKSGETSRETFRMVRAVLLEIPKPSKIICLRVFVCETCHSSQPRVAILSTPEAVGRFR